MASHGCTAEFFTFGLAVFRAWSRRALNPGSSSSASWTAFSDISRLSHSGLETPASSESIGCPKRFHACLVSEVRSSFSRGPFVIGVVLLKGRPANFATHGGPCIGHYLAHGAYARTIKCLVLYDGIPGTEHYLWSLTNPK